MKKKQHAFTLIELLVVVAIIGILAAVGVVAYNGYTASSKRSAKQFQHNMIKKQVRAIITNCEIDGTMKLNANISRPERTFLFNCSQIFDGDNLPGRTHFVNHFINQGLKNPYGTISGTDYAVYNGSNSNAPDNEGLTFFYIGNWGTDCVIRIQSYWMNKNNNNYDHLNECLR